MVKAKDEAAEEPAVKEEEEDNFKIEEDEDTKSEGGSIKVGAKEFPKDDESRKDEGEEAEEDAYEFVLPGDESESHKPTEENKEDLDHTNEAQKTDEAILPISTTSLHNKDDPLTAKEEEKPKPKSEARERSNHHSRNNSKSVATSVQARLEALNKNVVSKNHLIAELGEKLSQANEKNEK